MSDMELTATINEIKKRLDALEVKPALCEPLSICRTCYYSSAYSERCPEECDSAPIGVYPGWRSKDNPPVKTKAPKDEPKKYCDDCPNYHICIRPFKDAKTLNFCSGKTETKERPLSVTSMQFGKSIYTPSKDEPKEERKCSNCRHCRTDTTCKCLEHDAWEPMYTPAQLEILNALYVLGFEKINKEIYLMLPAKTKKQLQFIVDGDEFDVKKAVGRT